MLCLLKAAALGAVLAMNVLTLSSAPARAGEGLPRSAQMLSANVYVPERLTLTAPSLPDDTFAVEKLSRAPRWVVFDFVTGIRTVELADGSTRMRSCSSLNRWCKWCCRRRRRRCLTMRW